MESNELLAKRERIQREILALESTLGADSSIIDLLSSDSSSDGKLPSPNCERDAFWPSHCTYSPVSESG